jgi:nucleotide-binding universal stress UspA family protein
VRRFALLLCAVKQSLARPQCALPHGPAFSNDPRDAIVDAVGAQRCDAIVMASHGRRGLAAALIGSGIHKVVARSSVPVLACK